MKMLLMLLAVVLTVNCMADGNKRRELEKRRPPMPRPVYATENPANISSRVKIEDMTPEERQKFSAARHRRFEIMVLINAYKIMPEKERGALRAELIKRIKADFQAVMLEQKERIARAEADLARLRQELAERESHGEELVNRELERLLKMQPFHRGNPRNKADKK